MLTLLTLSVLGSAPVPVAFHVKPCPLKVSVKGAPACTFVPVDGAVRGALKRMDRITCNVNGQVAFVGAGETPALSIGMSVVEATMSFVVPFLRTTSGQVRAVPDELSQPLLLDGALVGIKYGLRSAFWKEGVCEEPDRGSIHAFAPLDHGEIVALLDTWDRQQEVLLRDREGHWSSWGTLPRGFASTLRAQNGRVSLQYQVQDPALGLGLEYGTLFPERTEVSRRFPTFPPRMPVFAVSPGAPREGSHFSAAALAEFDWQSGELTVDRGAQRVLAASLKTINGCVSVGDELSERPTTDTFRHYGGIALGALDDATSIVAYVEDRGRCDFKREERAPRNCPSGAPCAPPEPSRWLAQITQAEAELVLVGVGARVQELARVPLGVRDPRRPSSAGVALTVTKDRVFVQATGFLIEFDRAALRGAR
jgi:hypothetical protein